ncbi:hypothetical protein HPP92_001415 [Vanilla planifolia]|uniref:SEC7 domain-containing protein n=1 Tax=Vanilla planifolia TaxID=51239 RepID=A0A835S2G6_VANPL|nr:hypothetical protein HPP92_001415 [Vanilla planifolia]
MASSFPEADSRLSHILVPSLEKIIKNAASWRKGHSKLAHQCKSLIDRLSANLPPPSPSSPTSPSSSSDSIPGPLLDLSLADSELFLSPLIAACSSGSLKLAEPALDCTHKLIAHSYLHGEADPTAAPDAQLLARLIDAACSCQSHADDALELLVVKSLLSAVTSTSLRIHGDSLLRIVRTCDDLYLNSRNPVNQTTAKASLIQMLVIVFRRMEADSSTVPSFITKIISDIDVVLNPPTPSASSAKYNGAFESASVENTNPADLLDSNDKELLDAKYWEISLYKTALEGRKDELGPEGIVDRDDDQEVQIGNKLRRDAFLVFRALCKLSMKTPPKEALADPTLMRGKILALELLKILLENAGAVFRTSDRFLGAIKQYLCLSLLKNSASTLIIIYQLSCSIFMSLVSRFRPGLKAEIGVFFPMIVLRVLENVAQPNFQQKMIVLRFLEKLCLDSQILVDIFVNYDCDVHSPNIFERMVNGLLKTAQGPAPGIPTTLIPPQDVNMKSEAMKCLVAILNSMGNWMNKQLRIPGPHLEITDGNTESVTEVAMDDGRGEVTSEVSDLHTETANGAPEAASLEKRRAYKLELQEGISIFNQKPKKGIEFLINAKKVGDSPEEVAVFLKDTPGLNKTVIGDYLGERDGLPLKVMYAYVDSFDFQGMVFDEAIRSFLQGFRLPGEAQKIDRIMEKFAQRYCKCNPNAFSSADTAYVLAYSVIMLNTDAHNPIVKNKMSPEDFISNNRGIDDGKDLPEEYLRALYERISKNEIKIKDDELVPDKKQSANSNRILGLDSILNIVIRKRDAPLETSDDLIKHMQEQFKEKARKSESTYYAASDVVILRFMVEVCWAPMLAAFSVPLDQSDDEATISQCLEGIRSAIHVTAVMSMKTQRDAFVTSLAKFTSLHSAADIKQKNIDAIKAVFLVAENDGNYLQEAWEHVLKCVSRFEHLHLLGEGAPPDATFFGTQQADTDASKQNKPSILPVLVKKGPAQGPYAVASARRGSYESVGVGGHASGVVTSEQLNNLVSNLNMLEQVGIVEVNNIFIRSEKLNSEAIVDFVEALCKVSLEELRSTSDPRIFSLTKIVEIAHYNMKRIRLVWSRTWHVLSNFFVAVGCSENLSIAIFAMDSLRQLAKKFIEREELANYNFQNEFLKPFVIVMRKSRAVEIREVIIRCVSQMVLSCASSVKSGWKSMFMIFTTASYDDHKNIVFLAFEIIERILREYFPYITETETNTFTDCVNCLIAFTNSRFNKEISLKAISFLRFCAAKLAEGELGSSAELEVEASASTVLLSPSRAKYAKDSKLMDKDDHLHLWFPLLAGLSELTFDLRPEIRKSALEVLFETLRNHGHRFTLILWEKVFDSALFPIFDYVRHAIDPSGVDPHGVGSGVDTVHPLLNKVLVLLISFIKRPHQSLASFGVASFVRLMNNAASLFTEDKWLKDDTHSSSSQNKYESADTEHDSDSLVTKRVHSTVAVVKCRAAIQLLLIQAVMEIYDTYRAELSVKNTIILFEALHNVATHAHKINNDSELRMTLQDLSSITQMQDPPLLRLENEAYQLCLTLLQNIVVDKPVAGDSEIKAYLINLCREVLQGYLNAAKSWQPMNARLMPHWFIPLGSGKRRELAARAPLVVATLRTVCGLPESTFERNLALFFPLFIDLVRCEHGTAEVQVALSDMLSSSIGSILLQSS